MLLDPSRITPEDAALPRTGNRFDVAVGGVPKDWRAQRQLITVEAVAPLPFVDTENPITDEYLTAVLAPQLEVRGINQLDIAAVRGTDRALTRAISTWAYVAATEDGDPTYSGIRYKSRLGDHEGWAVFDGTELRLCNRRPIELTDPDLQTVADRFGLRIF